MENKEHNLQDKRCECCGYMTYHREHMGCIRAARQSIAAAEQAQQAEPVAWKHDCAALLMNDVELWVRNCPHCGKPRAAQPPTVADLLAQLDLAETEVINAKSWSGGEQAKTHCDFALTAIATARQAMYAAAPQATAEDSSVVRKAVAVQVALPPYDVFSNDDGDSWETHPASDNFVHGLQLGEEFELLAGWQAERVTFRVTKVPDDESDDYEVEEVNPAPVAIKKPVHVLVDALEKLARLGAGDRYGNSDGNRIAQQALATYRDYTAQPPAVAVAVPDGYALVPKEPTQEMLEAAWQYHCSEAYNTTRPDAETDAECYRAMLAATEQPK